MLTKCTAVDAQRALDYIGSDRLLCFYMYMDIIECGVESEGLGLWISETNDNIDCIMYQYYDCLHIFSREICPVNEVLHLIDIIKPDVISSNEENISALKQVLDMDNYIYELNHIITADKYMEESADLNICVATEADIPEIAELMMKEHIYNSVYSYDKLCDSLTRRFKEGFGRMFIIRDPDDRLIATNATNAETSDLAVIGGLVTDTELRGRGLGRAITASTWNLMKREGKQGLAFLITDNTSTIAPHEKMGFSFIGLSARLIKKK